MTLVAELRGLGLDVVDDPDVLAGHVVDWTGRFTGTTPALVRAHSTDDVARLLAWCQPRGVPVVPQGGNTGLVGGGVPRHGEVLLSLRGLDRLDAVDRLAGQVTAGAGVTLARLQEHARAAGLAYGVDLTARASATIGGTVATNAGGTRVLRYGPTRAQVVGVEAVLADGSVITHLGGLLKDNTGYDLAGLLVGSEGTLGVVTAARLRLVPRHDHRVGALLALDTVADAVEVAARCREELAGLDAVEAVVGPTLAFTCATLGLPPPFPSTPGVALLVEAAARVDPTDELAEVVAGLGDVVRDALVATDAPALARLWAYREGVAEAVARTGVPHKLDVTLPASRLAGFAERVGDVVAAAVPEATTHVFGHLGDGNLHVNVLGAEPDDDTVDDAVLRLVVELGGSISAEHGIGTAKQPWLALQRSPADLAAMRALKRALDPAGILNPHALLGPLHGDGSLS